MSEQRFEIIDVNHECNDGWHKFRSPQVPGFYLVACKDDLEETYLDIPDLLGALIESDHGYPVQIQSEMTYDKYLQDYSRRF